MARNQRAGAIEELAMGALAIGGVRILNTGMISALGISKETIEAVTTTKQRSLSAANVFTVTIARCPTFAGEL